MKRPAPSRPSPRAAAVALALGLLAFTGCATNRAQPLAGTADLLPSVPLTVPASRFVLPAVAPHPLDPAAGLDESSVIALAVWNNPDLKAARLRAGLADAQVLEAGLLPDPQLSGGLSRSSLFTGYAVALSESLEALVTRRAARRAAQAGARQVNLEILWQEWQVAERAGELFIQARADDQLEHTLTPGRDLLAQTWRQEQAALERGEATAGAVATELDLLRGADAALRQVQLEANQTRHELNRLLGLGPEVRLILRPPTARRPLTPEELRAAVAAAPRRRADLLALQAGYESQEQRVREAVLAQFPALRVGVEKARSAEEGVHTSGFTIDVTLPLFNRNRGQIALERATRAVLRQTYQARLDDLAGEADRVWQATRILARQQRELEDRLPELRRAAAAAEQDFRQGNLTARAYLELSAALQAQTADVIRTGASLDAAQLALQVLLGLPLAPETGPR